MRQSGTGMMGLASSSFSSPLVGEDSKTWRCGAEPLVDLGEGYYDVGEEFGAGTADPSPRSTNAHFVCEVDLSSPTGGEEKVQVAGFGP